MTYWKRVLAVGIGWGIGTGVTLALTLGLFLRYNSRPKPPKPWNSAAITATYDFVDTEADKNTVVFIYTLENNTDFDYRAEEGQEITMSAKLNRQNSLSPFAMNGDFSKIDYPIVVPAKKRIEFLVHLSYPCPIQKDPNANDDEEETPSRRSRKIRANRVYKSQWLRAT